MKSWIVEPRDTLVIRDGRPIQEGAPRMQSVDFPWPSTIAGFVRGRIGTNERGVFALSPDEAKQISVRGPWLVELDAEGRVVDHYLPAPRDCIWFLRNDGSKEFLERRRLSIMPPVDRTGCITDLDDGLQFVHCVASLPTGKKPLEKTPVFWRLNDALAWLHEPLALSQMPRDFGLRKLEHERRFHVSIDETTLAARDEHLFSTDGLRFTTSSRKRLGIALQCGDGRLREGLAIVGGERRISFLREAKELDFPSLPHNFKLGKERIARVILLTPAIFANGFAPKSFGPGTTVIGAVVDRAEVISGWDFAKRGPKPTRRMAPAGSAYWVQLDPDVDPRAWAKGIWMNSVSDDPQDQRDGFGLAVVGVG